MNSWLIGYCVCVVLCCWVDLGACLEVPVQCGVYCGGPLLETIQRAGIFPDSKTFVDMPLKADPEDVLKNFHSLSNHSLDTLLQFLRENFLPAGSEILPWTPTDFHPNPPFVEKLQPNYRQFAIDVNNMWQFLGKTLAPDVSIHPTRYSIIPQPKPFIVPGDRFHEFYYWDSYWIISGLLVCDMQETALGIIQNALALIRSYGFVPNGARIYYLNRSQPPLLSEMIRRYLQADANMDLLEEALPLLLNEYNFWMDGDHAVTFPDGLVLNRFYSPNDQPRPESFIEDYNHSLGMDEKAAKEFFGHIAAGAESGEDFTSRWFRDADDIRTIETAQIIPVDLNSFMYKFESNMREFYRMLNRTSPIDFDGAMEKRREAMDRYLWNENANQWYDYSLTNATQILKSYPSNWFPIWSGAYDNTNRLNDNLLESLLSSGLVQQGGVQSTISFSGQQWDSPNSWAPHQSLVVRSLQRLGTPKALAAAEKVAKQWIDATHIGYQKTKMMHEKYNAYVPGDAGTGGEYPPQVGFGWTNGVTLEFLEEFGV
eukprot:TRINITY_DN562_c0_g1_i1.p1 TRINITY_DN562_c0_g1~~TRINITY_DN562_c0_g1_i1.p1  ORF type:complete len:541 (+),score=96.18 TRINITY_DN562_c0_g1_i1:130-1752(+)